MAALAERVVDRKVLKAIRTLLRAGVFDGEQLLSSDTGTPKAVSSRPCSPTSTSTGSTGNGNGATAGWGGSSATQTIW